MKKFLYISALAGALWMPTIASAADNYEIDAAHTWVGFSIGHAGWSNAQGKFGEVSGTISFDRENTANSTVNIEISTASIDTNLEARDEHLRSPDFFNVVEFPTITFSSKSIEITGENTGLIIGDLTMIGTTKSVTLNVTFNNEAPLPWDSSVIKAGFSATTTITPADFGMSKVPEFGLGPDVVITIDTEAVKE